MLYELFYLINGCWHTVIYLEFFMVWLLLLYILLIGQCTSFLVKCFTSIYNIHFLSVILHFKRQQHHCNNLFYVHFQWLVPLFLLFSLWKILMNHQGWGDLTSAEVKNRREEKCSLFFICYYPARKDKLMPSPSLQKLPSEDRLNLWGHLPDMRGERLSFLLVCVELCLNLLRYYFCWGALFKKDHHILTFSAVWDNFLRWFNFVE